MTFHTLPGRKYTDTLPYQINFYPLKESDDLGVIAINGIVFTQGEEQFWEALSPDIR